MAQLTPVFQNPAFWLVIIALALVLSLAAWRLRLAWRPAWLLRLLLIGIILLSIFTSDQDLDQPVRSSTELMVVDQSDSLSESARLQAWQTAIDWQSAENNRLVLAFGAETEILLPGGDRSNGIPLPHVDRRASNLADALLTAGDLLQGTERKIILATDGLVNDQEQVSEIVENLAREGYIVDVLPLEVREAANDLAVGNIYAPANLWAGTSFDLFVLAYGLSDDVSELLRLKINGIDSDITPEPAGGNYYRFRIRNLPQGQITIEALIDIDASGEASPTNNDSFPGNNSSYVTLQVFPSPRVLFVSVEPDREAAVRFIQNLKQTGIDVTVISPDSLVTNLTDLQRYKVIFLDNLLSSQLGQEQMRALQVFVSRLAGGLVFLGGRNSYTLGGYQGTLIEPMLPVKLEPPPRSKRPPIVFQLILDRSSSMEINSFSSQGAQPIALAREAAMRAIETLKVDDYLGVLTFSDLPTWDVPLQQLSDITNMRLALDAVSRVVAYGGTQMYAAMKDALASMDALPSEAPQNRHLLILSDGQSSDGSEEAFELMAQTAHDSGITISTIALGQDADTDLMAGIAEAGEGRFYMVENASDLPRILIAESEAARSENIQTGEIRLKIGGTGHPILFGLSQGQLPTLTGYNALTSKAEDGAEDVLISSSFGDPILATWQWGLGRVVAWAGDIGQEWTGIWPEGVDGVFWSQVVRYALINPALGPAQVNVRADTSQLIVEAFIASANSEPLNLSEPVFTYADQENIPHAFPMIQVSAGEYQLTIPRLPDGAYRASLAYIGEDGQRIEIPTPFAVNPPSEWLPVDPSTGIANLSAWASVTGGMVTQAEQHLRTEETVEITRPSKTSELWQRLLLVVVVLWPVEIAIRRRWLSWV